MRSRCCTARIHVGTSLQKSALTTLAATIKTRRTRIPGTGTASCSAHSNVVATPSIQYLGRPLGSSDSDRHLETPCLQTGINPNWRRNVSSWSRNVPCSPAPLLPCCQKFMRKEDCGAVEVCALCGLSRSSRSYPISTCTMPAKRVYSWSNNKHIVENLVRDSTQSLRERISAALVVECQRDPPDAKPRLATRTLQQLSSTPLT